jgi:galactokinase
VDVRAEPATELDPLLRAHAASFRARFGAAPGVRRFFSPGRVNLMGAHLDYNGGPVMPMAIDRGTFIAVRPRDDDLLNLASSLEEGVLSVPLHALPRSASKIWHDYPLGVVIHLLRGERSARGLDVLYGGNLPIGAGLSSSASICVGTAHAVAAVWELPDDPMRSIEAALWGEREFVGVRCGIMDPYAVSLTRPNHLLWLECKDARTEHLPFDNARLTIAVVDSGIRRGLALGDFNQRVAECARALELLRERGVEAACLADVAPDAVEAAADALGPTLARRARHVVSEVERTRRARAAVLAGDFEEFGRCIGATHGSLRDLYEVSVPELDCIVAAALAWEGCLGARLTGAGFGGCAVVLLETEARAGFAEHVQRAFEERFRRTPTVGFFRGGSGPREVT